jgi:tetratricopeptide (TPR) repeat protein
MNQDKFKQALEIFIDTNFVLIVSSNKAERSNFRKVFSDLGVKATQIQIVGNFSDARDFIKKNKTQIVLAQDFIDNDSCEEFLIEHVGINPDRSKQLYFVLASDRRHALISLLEEKYIDNIFYKPITVEGLTETISDILVKKIKIQQNEFYKQYWKLKKDLKNENLKTLIGLVPEFRLENPDSADAIYLEGLFYEKQGLKDEAIDRYKETLEVDPSHILCLKHLFDIYYNKEDFINTSIIGKLIIDKFTIHPNRIKSLIKSLIITKDFDCIISISKKYLTEDMEDTRLERTIAASLAIAGKSGYLRASIHLFRELTHVSLKHARDNLNITYMCLNNLLDMGDLDTVKEYLARSIDSSSEDLLKIIQYRIDEKIEKNENVFIKGAELTNSGLHDFYVYEIWLKSAMKANKKEAMIENIIDQAVKHHPIRKNHFIKMKA